MFYDTVADLNGQGQGSGGDWNALIATLKDWIAQFPESITARVALAHAYQRYGQQVRGTSFAYKVPSGAWATYDNLVGQARQTLADAANLPEKCPYWYEAMQQVAIAQGWPRERARALLDEAIAFEPAYYHYYREYANYLLPKWYGEEGDAEAFANEVMGRVGGQQGAFLYFEIASLINCDCTSDGSRLAHMSWPKIKEGYAALESLYGTSNTKMNRFALMTWQAKDKAAARQIFSQIGIKMDLDVWQSGQEYATAINWALRN